jgi:hypothetical protein
MKCTDCEATQVVAHLVLPGRKNHRSKDTLCLDCLERRRNEQQAGGDPGPDIIGAIEPIEPITFQPAANERLIPVWRGLIESLTCPVRGRPRSLEAMCKRLAKREVLTSHGKPFDVPTLRHYLRRIKIDPYQVMKPAAAPETSLSLEEVIEETAEAPSKKYDQRVGVIRAKLIELIATWIRVRGERPTTGQLATAMNKLGITTVASAEWNARAMNYALTNYGVDIDAMWRAQQPSAAVGVDDVVAAPSRGHVHNKHCDYCTLDSRGAHHYQCANHPANLQAETPLELT